MYCAVQAVLAANNCFCICERRKIILRKYYFLAIAALLIAALATPSFAAIVSVTIQDTTPLGNGTTVRDTCLRSDGMPNWNGGTTYGNGAMRMMPDVGYTSGKGPRHWLLWFDVSSVPSNAVINTATFGFYMNASGGTQIITDWKLSRLKPGVTWNEGLESDPAQTGDPCWNYRQYNTTAWGAAGCTGDADIDKATTIGWGMNNEGTAWKTIDVKSFVQDWVSGAYANNGMVTWGGVGPSPGSRYYYATTSEEPIVLPTPGNLRPYLTVTWNDGAPVIASPIGNAEITTLTPTITWSSNATGTVINHQVRICTTDDASAAVSKDSGTVAGNALSWVSPTLSNLVQYYAFAREETASGWSPWSPVGTGGFHTAVTAPAAPVITAPSGTVADPKPTISFPAAAGHSSLQVKIFTSNVGNPETAGAYYDSGVVVSSGNSCPSGMLANNSYWAFVKIENVVGWSPWSAGHAFTVARADWVDVLQMNETTPDLLNWNNPGGTAAWTGNVLTDPSRQDGFHDIWDINAPYAYMWTNPYESGACGAQSSNKVLTLTHAEGDPNGAPRSIRMHKCQDEIDLDRGVTFMWEMAVQTGSKGAIHGGKSHVCGSVYLGDKGPDGAWHRVSVLCREDYVSIISTISDAIVAGTDPGPGWNTNRVAVPYSQAYRRYRLTGRNAVAGDYNTTKWDLYVDDVRVTGATGTFNDTADPEADPPYQRDFIAIGAGENNLRGQWSFDWVGVNGGGDYGPGEWNPIPASQSTFNGIGAAKVGLVGNRAVTINGSMVITKVISHLDIGPDQTPGTGDDSIVQDCYYVQDLTNGLLGSAVRAVTADTQSGAVAVGKQVTHLTGVFAESGGCRSLNNASATISSADPIAIQGTAMSQKTLMSPCVSQGLGSNMDTSGMLVRVYGRVPTAPGFVGSDVFPPSGAYIVYVDDGSGAVDGRETSDGVPYPGIRVLIDASDPAAVIPSFGDYLLLEGIAGYENITTGAYPTVRQIIHPTITVVASGV
jgi:hypothetical protein